MTGLFLERLGSRFAGLQLMPNTERLEGLIKGNGTSSRYAFGQTRLLGLCLPHLARLHQAEHTSRENYDRCQQLKPICKEAKLQFRSWLFC
jgi:hypothetical protein